MIGIVMQADGGRYGRERIDMPLAIASMDIPVQIFVLGGAVNLLRANQSGELTWTKLWRLAADMQVPICIPNEVMGKEVYVQQNLLVEPVIMSEEQMASAMASCKQLVYV